MVLYKVFNLLDAKAFEKGGQVEEHGIDEDEEQQCRFDQSVSMSMLSMR